jgi:hypothetical protein
MLAARTISDSLLGRVAMSRAASGLAPKAVGRSPSPSVERLVHHVVVKVSAHLKVTRRAGRCIAAAALRAGWGVAGASVLGVGSSLRNSAVLVETRDLVAHAVLRPASSIIAAPARSSLGSNAVGNIVVKAPATLSGPCISLRRRACVAENAGTLQLHETVVRTLLRLFTGARKDRMARRR